MIPILLASALLLLPGTLPVLGTPSAVVGMTPSSTVHSGPAPRAAAADTLPLYDDLGHLSRPVTVATERAQAYFDQGLRLTWAFNHPDAVRSFRKAADLDEGCAMCWWGVALALGPNINVPMDGEAEAEAAAALAEARARLDDETEVERALVAALSQRYAEPFGEARARKDSAYAGAMAWVAQRFPLDDDISVLYGEAEMLLGPWDYWTPDREPRPHGRRAVSALRRVVDRSPDHVGACHFYIHAVESAWPERAVPCAERLPELMPGAGHVVHMPAHVYIRVGRYVDAIERNRHAVHADEGRIGEMAPDGVYRLALYPHNYHFLWFASTMAGQSGTALEAARDVAARVDRARMDEPGLGALQHYLVSPLLADVRFGRWDEILAGAGAPAELPYPKAMWHYARGMAFVGIGRLDDAEGELIAARALRREPALARVTVWDLNPVTDLVDIALLTLEADLASARGHHPEAVRLLREALHRETALTYDEPPPWPIPVRHLLGAELLRAGRFRDAETVYRADLAVYPENGWALAGLRRALEARGRSEEAAEVEARLLQAWRTADVELTGSRF